MYNYSYPYYPQQPARTDIGQVNSEQEAINTYVAAGSSRIMFTPDDKTVYVKCVSMNGQVSMDIFDRRLPEPVSLSGVERYPEYPVVKDPAFVFSRLSRDTFRAIV